MVQIGIEAVAGTATASVGVVPWEWDTSDSGTATASMGVAAAASSAASAAPAGDNDVADNGSMATSQQAPPQQPALCTHVCVTDVGPACAIHKTCPCPKLPSLQFIFVKLMGTTQSPCNAGGHGIRSLEVGSLATLAKS